MNKEIIKLYKKYDTISVFFSLTGIILFFISYQIFLLPILIFPIVTILGFISLYFRKKARSHGIKEIPTTLLSYGCTLLGISYTVVGLIYLWIIS